MTLTVILILSAVVAGLDQLFKYLVVQNLAPDGHVTVIDHLLSLVYVENRGVAFGMFQNHIWVFALVTFLFIGVFVYLIVSKRFHGKLFYLASVLIIGGGIGNLLDRLFRGFVVDYLSLSFFPPVCNFADYCITFGAVLFIIVLFTQNGDGKKALTKDTENASDLSVSETVDSSAQIAAVTDNAHTATDSTHTVTNSTDNADTSALKNTDGEADGN